MNKDIVLTITRKIPIRTTDFADCITMADICQNLQDSFNSGEMGVEDLLDIGDNPIQVSCTSAE